MFECRVIGKLNNNIVNYLKQPHFGVITKLVFFDIYLLIQWCYYIFYCGMKEGASSHNGAFYCKVECYIKIPVK